MYDRASKCAALLLALVCLHACSSGEDTRTTNPPVPAPPTPPPPPPPTGNEPSGLDARPSNTTCLAWDRPTADDTISLTRYTNLTFASPIAMLQAPNDSSRWFIVEQGGTVFTFAVSNPTATSVFIDLSGPVDASAEEMGLLGMAFHPNFPQDPRVFLSYTNSDSGRVSRISSFRTLNNGTTLDPGTERILLTVNQPETNHKGGNIAFGQDGLLYIGFGDGGGANDNHGNPGNGQRLTTMLGKMLRINVGTDPNGTTYTVPDQNPFFNAANPGDKCPAAARATGNCPEIYAYGFRNPWRWSFDRNNGELWVADVGQGMWEEVNQVTINGNYGWRCREGAHNFNTSGCSGAGLIDPVAEYDHTEGVSITGGYVYRGTQNTNLAGRFLFADFGSGRIWAWIAESAATPREPTLLLDSSLNISTFGQANNGELYVVHYGTGTNGTLHHIEFETGPVSNGPPAQLSQTGCVVAANPQQPAPGLIPYAINAPFWSDGANKERWLALPDGQSMTVRADGDWDFPNRSVLMKNFRVGTRLIETRLLMRHPDGSWGGFTYEWNAGQTDATLLEGGAVRNIGNGQNWIFPSEAQCLICHTQVANRALGLETAQLNRTLTYTQTGRTANELATLSHIGLLSPPITDSTTQPAMPDPADTTATLTNRARAYLHTNCSQCHRTGGPTPSNMDLHYATALNATNACNAMPTAGDLGLGANARLIAPGSAANSILVNRANRRDGSAMPPLGSNQLDTAGVTLLTQWVNSLTGC